MKCPNCNSSRTSKTKKGFFCKKCGYTNKIKEEVQLYQ